MPQNVLIIGAGALGQALGKALPKDRAQVFFFDADASKCPGGCQPLETLVGAANFIFLCIPSWSVRTAVAQVAALIRPGTAVLSMAKGLESPTAKTMYDVCSEVLPPNQPLGVLGGALLAHEIGSGLPGMGVIACTDDGLAANLLTLFQGSSLQFSWSSDARSVALGGVLKNIYALVLGIGDGLGLGSNARGWLFAQAVREMLDIAKFLQVDSQVILSVAGIGDLVATGLATQSKNHTAGMELARTGRTAIECEGVVSFPVPQASAGSDAKRRHPRPGYGQRHHAPRQYRPYRPHYRYQKPRYHYWSPRYTYTCRIWFPGYWDFDAKGEYWVPGHHGYVLCK